MTGIVILNYKNWQDTINCVNLLLNEFSENEISLTIVDNNSHNGSFENIIDHINSCNYCLTRKSNHHFYYNDYINVIASSENVGYAKGNNIGINYLISKKQVSEILILNNDALLNKEALLYLKEGLYSDDNIALAGPLIRDERGNIDYTCMRKRNKISQYLFQKGFMGLFFGRLNETKMYKAENAKHLLVEIISGSCMLFKTEKLIEIGLFDSNTFLYSEEAIIHEKLRSRGLKTICCLNSSIIHFRSKSTNKISIKVLHKHQIKSLLYYLKEYRKVNYLIRILIKLNYFLWFQYTYATNSKK